MPRELVILGIALLIGAWFVLDQRSLGEKFGLILLVLFIYVGYQFLGGASLSDILNSFGQILVNQPPPPVDIEE